MRFSFHYLLPVILFFTGIQTGYTQTIHSNIKALSEGADLIIAGKVTEQKAEWNRERTMISTRVTIMVNETIKGNNQNKPIVVTHPGGEIDNAGEFYSHIPTFTTNEEVLLFLKKYDTDLSYRVFEGESGKLTLYTDDRTGEKITSGNITLKKLKDEIKSALSAH